VVLFAFMHKGLVMIPDFYGGIFIHYIIKLSFKDFKRLVNGLFAVFFLLSEIHYFVSMNIPLSCLKKKYPQDYLMRLLY